MIELDMDTCRQIYGGFKIKIPVKLVVTIVSTIGATLVGGPVAGGMVLAGAIAAQGATNLTEMINNENINVNLDNTPQPSSFTLGF